jgi:hypothetical protein
MKTMISVLISLSIGVCLLDSVREGRADDRSVAELHRHAAAIPRAQATPPYIGNWSNGRGESLSITRRTLRFANDKPVRYQDVTRVTDNRRFAIKITSKGKINYFSKFLVLEVNKDEMKMTLYSSYEDMFNGQNSQGETTWYR